MPLLSSLFLSLLLSFLTTISSSTHSCSNSNITCPPFTISPPFPFSFSTGCGHPDFQIHCASNNTRASISINNLSFSLLQYEPNSTSLILSPNPLPSNTQHHNCSSPLPISTLNRPISLSGSTFRVSDSSCSRLSVFKPCSPPHPAYCTHCKWVCDLIQNPLHLIQDCGSSSTRHGQYFQSVCRDDVLGVLDSILRNGIEVEWDEDTDSYFSNCTSCRARNGVCGFNSSESSKPFVCFTSSRIIIREKSVNKVAVFAIVFVFSCILLSILVVIVIFRCRRKRSMDSDEDPTIVFLRRHQSASLLPPVFSYEELDSSTNGFDPKLKIGNGGFGSVYLGNLYDGRFVAVKHLHKPNSTKSTSAEQGSSTKSFCNEILILSSIEHPNLVKLHGYCSDPRGLLLVYDYVPNGTLADHLHEKHSVHRKGALSWNTRVDIAFQIATAIEYLHFTVVPPIVHRDITCSNIFVEKDMRVKVGDFGLSRLLVCSDNVAMVSGNSSEGVWTGPQGTPGYLDPDYYRSFRLNEKSDVYSFGVVLLELITGKRAVDGRREKREVTLVDLVVPKIQIGLLQQVVDPFLLVDTEVMEGVCAVAELAFRCVAIDKDDRPDAREMVEELRRIKGFCRRGVALLRGSNSSNVVVPDGIGKLII